MSGTQATRESFDAALGQYLSKLAQVSNTLRERQEQAVREYLQTEAGGTSTPNGGNSNEYESLLAALRSQSPGQIAAAQVEYLDSLQKLRKSASATSESALSGYLARVQELWHEAQNESKAHFAAYVEAVRNAFAMVGPPEADSTILSAIGQNLITAAFYAAASIQPVPAAAGGAPTALTANS